MEDQNKQPEEVIREYLGMDDCLSLYPLSRRKILTLVRAGRLPAYRVDGKVVILRKDIEEFLTSTPYAKEEQKRGGLE